MTRVIQIRGLGGSGKTELARSFIAKHGLEKSCIADVPVMVGDKLLFIGDYTKAGCAGADRIQPLSRIVSAANLAFDMQKFDYVLFEHKLLSTTFKGVSGIIQHCGKKSFGVLSLIGNVVDVLNHVYERNGGKEINVDALVNDSNAIARSVNKLKRFGVYTKSYPAYLYEKQDMYKVIDDFVQCWV